LIETYAWPLRIANFLGLDSAFFVKNNIYVLHVAYLIIGDYFYVKFGQAFFGKKYVDLAFLLRVSNALYSDFMSRPFGNTVEEICFVFGLYYFKKIQDS
jgi:hypothetical protein